jgi:hypothetical protein
MDFCGISSVEVTSNCLMEAEVMVPGDEKDPVQNV